MGSVTRWKSTGKSKSTKKPPTPPSTAARATAWPTLTVWLATTSTMATPLPGTARCLPELGTPLKISDMAGLLSWGIAVKQKRRNKKIEGHNFLLLFLAQKLTTRLMPMGGSPRAPAPITLTIIQMLVSPKLKPNSNARLWVQDWSTLRRLRSWPPSGSTCCTWSGWGLPCRTDI